MCREINIAGDQVAWRRLRGSVVIFSSNSRRGASKSWRERSADKVSRRPVPGTKGNGESTTNRPPVRLVSWPRRHQEDAGMAVSSWRGSPLASSNTNGRFPSRTTRSAALSISGAEVQRTHSNREQAATVWEDGSKPSAPSIKASSGRGLFSPGSPISAAITKDSPAPGPAGMISEIAP
jgi:hypothetical protein